MSINAYLQITGTAPLGRVLALLCAAVPMLVACDRAPPPAPQPGPKLVSAMQVKAADTAKVRRFPGRVRAAERVELSFDVAGRLVELAAEEGREVSAGDVLGRLDPRDFQSELKAAAAELTRAQANFERAAKLVEQQFISETEYDQLRAKRSIAAARLSTARKAREDAILRAPFAGVVAKRLVENHTDVQAKQPVLRLQHVAALEVVVEVPERLIAMRRHDTQGELAARFDSLPGLTFPLSIRESSAEADPKTGAFEVVTVMAKPEGVNILPGMTVEVVARRADFHAGGTSRFILPARALVADNAGQPYVWVIDEHQLVHRRSVNVGPLSGSDDIVVIGGIEIGDVVALSAVARLRDGMTVRTAKTDAQSDMHGW